MVAGAAAAVWFLPYREIPQSLLAKRGESDSASQLLRPLTTPV